MSDSSSKNQILNDYPKKRVHSDLKSIDLGSVNGVLIELLQRLSLVNDDEDVSLAFSSIFENSRVGKLKYVKQKPSETIEAGVSTQDHLLIVDIAFIFHALVFGLGLGETGDLDAALDESKNITDDSTKNALIIGFGACQTHDSSSDNLNISVADSFNNIYSTGKINSLAKFFLELLRPDQEVEEEETDKDAKEEEPAKTGEPAEDDTAETTASITDDPATDSGDDADATPNDDQRQPPPQQQPTPTTPPTPQTEQDRQIETLHDPNFRREATRLANVTLVQLEKFYDLPEGFLFGTSSEAMRLRGNLTEKSISFLLTSLDENRLNRFTQGYERLALVQEFSHFILNDPKMMELLGGYVTRQLETLDPDEKKEVIEKIEENLKADPNKQTKFIQDVFDELETSDESGEEIVELIKDPNNRTTYIEGPSFAKTSKSFFADIGDKTPEEKLAFSTSSLSGRAKNKVVELLKSKIPRDRVELQYININETVNALISLSLPIEIMDHLSFGSFGKIFGDEIPYNLETLIVIRELWVIKRSNFARKYGMHLNVEALAATQEAMDAIAQNEEKIIDSINKRVKDLAENARGEDGIPDIERIIAIQHQNPNHPDADPEIAKRSVKLNNGIWNEMSAETGGAREQYLTTLSYSPIQVKQIVTTTTFTVYQTVSYVPLTPHTTSMLYPDMAPAYNAGGANLSQDPIARSLQRRRALQSYHQANKSKDGLRGRLKEAGGNFLKKQFGDQIGQAKEQLKDQLFDGAAEAAKVAANAYGGPVLGEAAKRLVLAMKDEKKRKVIFAVAGGGAATGLALAYKFITTPLAAIGGLGGAVTGLFTGEGMGAGFLNGAARGAALQDSIAGWFGGGNTPSVGFNSPGLSLGKAASSVLPNLKSPASGTGSLTAAESTAAASSGATASTGILAATTATQAIAASIGTVTFGTIFTFVVIQTAFLADFPQVDPLGTIDIQGKQSQYVTVEKRAFAAGCHENKCEDATFPLKVEYSVIIKTKGNYTVYTKDILDEIKVNHSSDEWGGNPPNVSPGKTDLSEYIDRTIGPGESLEIAYTKVFDEKYNHSTIINTFDLELYYTDPSTGEEGIDHAITGEVIYVGKYSQGEGCWPVSGTITQLPGDKSSSHHNADAFDVGAGAGTPIYTPFGGTACSANIDPGFGTHVTVESGEGKIVYAHMSRSAVGGCKEVSPGAIIGYVGTTGNSTGNHLHFEIARNGGFFRSRETTQQNSLLGALMPDGNVISERSAVRSCYD